MQSSKLRGRSFWGADERLNLLEEVAGGGGSVRAGEIAGKIDHRQRANGLFEGFRCLRALSRAQARAQNEKLGLCRTQQDASVMQAPGHEGSVPGLLQESAKISQQVYRF